MDKNAWVLLGVIALIAAAGFVMFLCVSPPSDSLPISGDTSVTAPSPSGPRSPRTDQECLNEINIYIQKGDYAHAVSTLNDLKSRFPTSGLVSVADSLLTVCKQKQYNEDRRALDQWSSDSKSGKTEETIASLRSFVNGKHDSVLTDRAKQLLSHLLYARSGMTPFEIKGRYMAEVEQGMAHIGRGEWEQAEKMLEVSVEYAEMVYGIDSPEVTSSLVLLARTYLELRQPERALSAYDRAYPLIRKFYANDAELVRSTRESYARLLRRAGRKQEASQVESEN